MCFEKITLSSPQCGAISIIPLALHTQQSDDQKILLWQASCSRGEMFFGELRYQQISLWYMDFDINRELDLTIQGRDDETMALAFILQRNIPYQINELGRGIAKRNQYSITHFPEFHCTYHFRRGKYATFGIQYNPTFLKYLAINRFPSLQTFLQKISKGEAAVLTNGLQRASQRMLDLVYELHQFRVKGTLTSLYFFSRATELLRLALEEGAALSLVRSSVRKEVDAVCEFIRNNLDVNLSLRELAMEHGMNVFKLKTLFRKVHNKTVMAYIRETRLQRARARIEDSNWPLKRIAHQAGYNNLSNFITAFRKQFGITPGCIERG